MAFLIAFVGSEATGKSTILAEVDAWLRPVRPVLRIHVGKPPSTALTFVPHVLLPALRALFPRQRTLRVQRESSEAAQQHDRSFPLLFGIRSVMLAYERKALVRKAMRGDRDTIVLCDRYPSRSRGAPDGPQLATPDRRRTARRALAWLEARLYQGVPTPDLVFHLWAPLGVTLARNAAREKREPGSYVRFRHELSERFDFEPERVRRIDTDRDLNAVVEEIQEVIGGRLTIAD